MKLSSWVVHQIVRLGVPGQPVHQGRDAGVVGLGVHQGQQQEGPVADGGVEVPARLPLDLLDLAEGGRQALGRPRVPRRGVGRRQQRPGLRGEVLHLLLAQEVHGPEIRLARPGQHVEAVDRALQLLAAVGPLGLDLAGQPGQGVAVEDSSTGCPARRASTRKCVA